MRDLLPSQMDFAALMDVSFLKKYKHPILVSASDGVGTKLHLAQLFDYHKSIGIDLVAMCANDLLCSGAQTLQFLDYIACGKLIPERMEAIIASILEGCALADCVLAGGETAEHPDVMPAELYDLAGFAVGVVERDALLDGSSLQDGDIILGLPSSGVHANGYSLIRRLYLKKNLELPKSSSERDFLFNKLLVPSTLIYEPVIRPFLETSQAQTKNQTKDIKALAHITGGGFAENVPRVLPAGLTAEIEKNSWDISPLFMDIAQRARLNFEEMTNVFNMGIGMVAIVAPENALRMREELQTRLHTTYPQIKAPVALLGKIKARAKDTDGYKPIRFI